MEVSGSKVSTDSCSVGSFLNLRENRTYQAKLSYIMVIIWLLSYVIHIKLIALAV